MQNERIRTKGDQPSGEGTSLAGTKLGKFGGLAIKEKLPEELIPKKKEKK